jgi:formamidopyrimidine-DNA glycosylase
MPELPEVEFAARCLRSWSLGQRIVEVETDPGARRIFRPGTPSAFARAVSGAKVREVGRRGKHLLVTLERAGALVGLHSHLGMTGKWLRSTGEGEEPPSHSRARFQLEDGSVLHYQDPRLFGRLRAVRDARFEEVDDLRFLGPDPIEQGIDRGRLVRELAHTRAAVKVKLLDQRLLAGIGNIHAGEACFRARIDPRRPGNSLSRGEVSRLARAILDSFRMTLDAESGPEIVYIEEGGENPFMVYDREGELCPRCQRTKLQRIVQGQRSTYLCPRCQH